MTARKSNPMVRGSSDADKVGKAYRKAMELLPQLSEAEYKEEGLIEEAVHPVLDTLDDASRMRGLDPKVKASAAAVFQRLLHAVEMYDRLPSEGGHLASMREEYLEPHMKIGQTRRSNPRPAEHMEFAQEFLHKAKWLSQAGSLWDAYDTVMRGISQVEDAADFVSTEESQPLARELLSLKAEIKSRLKAQLQGGSKVSNPSPAEHLDIARHYLMASQDNEDDPWKAYDFTVMALTEATDAHEYDAPGAMLLLNQLQGRRIALRDALRGGGKVSNPRHGGAHYFVVLDKKGKQQFYTQTAAEARELLASNAKVRGGSYKHL